MVSADTKTDYRCARCRDSRRHTVVLPWHEIKYVRRECADCGQVALVAEVVDR